MPEQQALDLQEHVETCEACQRTLADLVEGDPSVEKFSQHLGEPRTASETALRLAMAKMSSSSESEATTGEPSAGSISLDFLDSSDEPGSQGRLAQYEISEVVGRGGMGIVLKGYDTKLGRVVAIKVLAPELASNATARKRFLREARAAAAVSHDHVVTIYAVDEDRLPYLVTEYIDGQSLQQKIDREGQLELKEILRIGRQVAAGLAAAHAQGLIHRDVKPSNILLQNSIERVQITDFGLARAVDDVGITRTGEVAGTPQFMSPEQAQGQPVDARSDLFSLGSVLYAMCTGRSPFRAKSTVAALRRVCDDTPRPIRDINPDIPVWLTEMIDRLLQKEPEKRIQTAAEVAELLSSHLAHLRAPSSTPPTSNLPAVRKPRRSKTRRWFVAAAAVLALLVGLGLTEATGVTQLSSTVLRIFTGEGTLVIEVDDPTVEVSLDGEELRISGAGMQEFRLRPGQYRFTATKDGQHVKTELVTITRGDRRLVHVSLEGNRPEEMPSDAAIEPGAFVVQGPGGFEEKFDTLAEAVQATSPGDTIEIRGDGPFVTDPIVIPHALTIKAGDGHRPVLRQSPESLTTDNLFMVYGVPLVLEGVALESIGESFDFRENHWPSAVAQWVSGSLLATNCRFVRGNVVGDCIGISGSGFSVVKNCEFVTEPWRNKAIRYYALHDDTRYVVDNCCVLADIVVCDRRKKLRHCMFQWRNNTVIGSLRIEVRTIPEDVGPGRESESPIVLHATGNVLNPWSPDAVLVAGFTNAPEQLAAQANLPFSAIASWRGEQNLFPPGTANNLLCVLAGADRKNVESLSQLNDWNRYWELADPGSLQGPIRFQGGEFWKIAPMDPQRIKADDFRLGADSAGYHAGPGGKDLGADVDFVGPGEAYERWKKTLGYQEWLEQTRALMAKAAEMHASWKLFVLQLRQARWREAANTFGSLLQHRDLSEVSDRVSAWAFMQYSIALVHLSEFDRYQQFCGELIEEFAATENGVLAEVVCRTCLIMPTEVDLSLLPMDVVDAVLQEGREDRRISLTEARTLFAYRSGEFEEAARWATEYHKLLSESSSHPHYQALLPRALAILAMAQYKSGARQEARKTYEEAKGLFEQLGDSGRDVWVVYTAILMREAAGVLGQPEDGDHAPSAPKPTNDTKHEPDESTGKRPAEVNAADTDR